MVHGSIRWWLSAGLCVGLGLTGCGRKQAEPKPEAAPAVSASPAAAPSEAASAAPAGVAAHARTGPFTASRETAEQAAASLRALAERGSEPASFESLLDPSQSVVASKLVGPWLVFTAALVDLRAAAEEKFGQPGAEAIEGAANVYNVDFGNGLREMFAASRFEEVRRDGPKAFVMATLADGQPVGAPLVFRENQGEWLLLLSEGDEAWPDQRLGRFSGMLSGPLAGASTLARAYGELAAKIRSGEVGTVESALAEVQRVTTSRG